MTDKLTEYPLVSILVPAYNSAEFLPQCLESLLAQSYSNIEVILIDDGSTDGTGEMCDRYAEEFSNIKVLHQANQGQAAARNNGLGMAEGEWLCYVDSDDVIHPQTIEILLLMAQREQVSMTLCSHIQVNDVPNTFEEISEPDCRRFDINEKNICDEPFDVWCITAKLIERGIVARKDLTPGRIYEDNAVILEWMFAAKRIAVTDEKFYYYRINSEGTTKKPFNEKRLDLLWALEQRMDQCISVQYKMLLAKTLIFYIHNTMYLCREIKKIKNYQLAKDTKHNTLKEVMRRIRYSANKFGVMLRVVKLFLLY